MAIMNTPDQTSAQMRASLRSKKSKCVVCEGELEKSNVGMMCHSCKDRLSGKHSIPTDVTESTPVNNAKRPNIKSSGALVRPFSKQKEQKNQIDAKSASYSAMDKLKLKKTRGVV